MNKICTHCKHEKPREAFGLSRREKDGLRDRCKECRRAEHLMARDNNIERARIWKEQNPEKVVAWKRTYKESGAHAKQALGWANRHRDRKQQLARESHYRHRVERNEKQRVRNASPEGRAYMRAWFKNHPGYAYEKLKGWKAKYPVRAKMVEVKKRAVRKGAPGDLTALEWKEILLFYGNACAQCRTSASVRPLTIDHYIPLAKGGVHGASNCWPLCMPCNAKKHTTVPSGAPPHVAVLLMTAAHQEATA